MGIYYSMNLKDAKLKKQAAEVIDRIINYQERHIDNLYLTDHNFFKLGYYKFIKDKDFNLKIKLNNDVLNLFVSTRISGFIYHLLDYLKDKVISLESGINEDNAEYPYQIRLYENGILEADEDHAPWHSEETEDNLFYRKK